jgi:uncharacterized protein YkwD
MRSALRRFAWGVAFGAALALALGCASGSTWQPPAKSGSRSAARAPARPARKPDLVSIEREVLARVNRYRRSEGLRVLASDARLAEIARGHSRAMAAGRTGFGHGGFQGRTRLVASRLPYKHVAENVARHRRDPGEIPTVAVRGWIGSRGHRRNIEGRFALTGVGAAVGADGSVYLTQIFVLPR